MDNQLVKICNKCFGEFPQSFFKKNPKMASGYLNQCKNCTSKSDKERYDNGGKEKVKVRSITYYYNNIQKAKEQRRNYYKENKVAISEKSKSYRELNKEIITLRRKNYYNRNRDKIINKVSIYSKLNPDKVRIHKIRYAHAKKNLDISFTTEDYNLVFERFNYKCFNCDSIENLQIDHNFPLSKGNPLRLDNAVLLCKSCNCSKHKKDPEQFYSPNKLWQLAYILKGTYVLP